MASLLIARKGRHQQRYENKLRLVAGCIPYKIDGKADDSPGDLIDRVQVLMISSPGRHDLIFPKGGWEQDETAGQAACREALEEAGVKGIITGTELGFWEFRSKGSENSCSLEGACKGRLFALQVTEELDFWPEQNIHTRQWIPVAEAFEACRYDWMRDGLSKFKDQLLAQNASSIADQSESSSSFLVMSSDETDAAFVLC